MHQPLPRGRRAFCQNRQASAHGPRASSLLLHYLHLLYARPGSQGRRPFVRTDKQAPRKQRVSEHYSQLCSTHQPLRPWTPWETFVRTDKQAVIHRLSTVCGWLSTGYGRIKKRLTGFLRALVHVSSSAAQEPWSPVHMGSVFSPWTTNDST